MKKLLAALMFSALSLVLVVGANQAGDKAKDKDAKKDDKGKPEFTISEVMKSAHAKGLLKTVGSGKATEAQKKQLLGYYIALHANVPAKGDPKLWEKQTTLILAAAQAVLKGEEGSEKSLLKAVNCGFCHKEFKEAKKVE